jgi:integrase
MTLPRRANSVATATSPGCASGSKRSTRPGRTNTTSNDAAAALSSRRWWLGEVEGLQVSLAAAEDKLAQIDNRSRNTATTSQVQRIVVSPELADVHSAVICRVRGADGAIPLVRARDSHELVWQPPAPLVFQRRTRAENRSLGGTFVASLLDEALDHTGLTDPGTGEPLHFTPHDFRRMFITDVVLNGLPPHIAQVIAGHRDIGVTMGYKAVYPDEATHRRHPTHLDSDSAGPRPRPEGAAQIH